MRIFFDMDGVLAKWNAGASIEEVTSPGYFINREPESKVAEAMKRLIELGYNVFILTSVFNDDHSRSEKIRWLYRHCPFFDVSRVVFCVYGENKADAVKACMDDILIDDFTPNLKAWTGIGIKYLNGINGTKGTWDGYVVSGNSSSTIMASTIDAIAEKNKENCMNK